MCCKFVTRVIHNFCYAANSPFWGKILAVFLGFSTSPESRLCSLRSSTGPIKRHLRRKHVFRAIIDLCATLRSGCVRAKRKKQTAKQIKKGTQKCYISRMFGSAPATDCDYFCTSNTVTDVFNRAMFCINRFKRFVLKWVGLP